MSRGFTIVNCMREPGDPPWKGWVTSEQADPVPDPCPHPDNRIFYGTCIEFDETKRGLEPYTLLWGSCCDCDEIVVNHRLGKPQHPDPRIWREPKTWREVARYCHTVNVLARRFGVAA